MTSSSQNNWLPETEELCSQLTAEEGWTQMKRTDKDDETLNYIFARIRTERGQAFQFALFLHEKAQKLRGVCQFSDETNGLMPGLVNAGAITTMHDAGCAVLATNFCLKLSFTAYMNINFKRPTPVTTAILMEAKIEKTEGKKMFLRSYLKSPDEKIVYSDCTSLWIDAENAQL